MKSSTKTIRSHVVAMLAFLIVATGSFAQSTQYTAQILPAPAGAPGGETRLLALNNLGQVFGIAGVIASSYVPVVWTGGSPSILPLPPGYKLPTGFGSGFGWDYINDQGTVVSVAKRDDVRGTRTIVWLNGVPEVLILPEHPIVQAYADAVGVVLDDLHIVPVGLNRANRVLVYTCEAYWIWTPETRSYQLFLQQGPFQNPTASHEGNHLNDSGHVVLDGLAACNPPSRYLCFQSQLYTSPYSSETGVSLPLQGPNLGSTYINNGNQVLAHFTGIDDADYLVLWDGAQTVNLGQGGYAALNDHGDVVFATGFPRTSFIYTNGDVSPLNVPAPISGPFFLNNAGQIAANTSLTVSQPYAVLFTPRFQLTTAVSPLDAGTIAASPSSADGFYDGGTSVQLTATPAPGYVFSNWSGDIIGTTNPESITMTAARSVTANFAPVATITITSSPPGLDIIVDGITYTAPQAFDWVVGGSHTIATTPLQAGGAGTRFVFADWSDAGAISHDITVPASAETYTANFSAQYLLTTDIAPTDAGAVVAMPSSIDAFYDTDSLVQLSASPNPGFVFSNWTGDLTGTTNPQSVTMSGPRSVTANFSPTVTELQSLTISPLSPSIFVGSTLQFAATGHYSDGSTRDLTSAALWTSSKTSVATVTSLGGLAAGIAKGNTTIRALAGPLSASTVLMVKAVTLQSITVTPAAATIAVGGTQQFSATGNYDDGSTRDITNTVSWSSAPKSVASVNSSGLATGLKPGTGTITAKSGGISGSATLTVN